MDGWMMFSWTPVLPGGTKTSSLVLEQIHLLAAQLKPHDRDPGMEPRGVHWVFTTLKTAAIDPNSLCEPSGSS